MGQKRRTKRGSYIVEAAVIVPVFIVAVLMLIAIVPAMATCENTVFSAVDELRLESIKSAFRKNPAAVPGFAETAGYMQKTPAPALFRSEASAIYIKRRKRRTCSAWIFACR